VSSLAISTTVRTLVLRRRNPLPSRVVEDTNYIGTEEFPTRYAADPNDVAAVKASLSDFGLMAEQADHAAQQIAVSGPADAFAAFLDHQSTNVGSGAGTLKFNPCTAARPARPATKLDGGIPAPDHLLGGRDRRCLRLPSARHRCWAADRDRVD
jgi:hypothetical protein